MIPLLEFNCIVLWRMDWFSISLYLIQQLFSSAKTFVYRRKARKASATTIACAAKLLQQAGAGTLLCMLPKVLSDDPMATGQRPVTRGFIQQQD